MKSAAVFALLAVATLGRAAEARTSDAVVERTRVQDAAAQNDSDAEATALAHRVDAVVWEAVQDQGLNLDISAPMPKKSLATDEQLINAAKDTWVVASRLERRRDRLVLKLIVVPPGSQVLFVRTQPLDPEDLEMRVVLMMRDLIKAARGQAEPASAPEAARPKRHEYAVPAHSPGKAVLALSGALLGGFVGYSLQQASDSEDERLVYPLTALGAGIGIGGSMLVAEEWDIGAGDAWFLSAGMTWPVLSGLEIARSFSSADSRRYAYGLLGATAGVTLGATALSRGHISEGGAALTHSGGAFGTLLGGLIDLSIDGRTDRQPDRGFGFGAGIGVAAAGVFATQVDVSASRVLLIDLAASLGALTGAAAASPVLLVDDARSTNHGRNRIWLASVAAGTLAGGVVGYFATRSDGAPHEHPVTPVSWMPSVGVIASDTRVPAFGVSIQGKW